MGNGRKVILVGVMFGLVVLGLWISANNKEKSLRNQATAQQKICQTVFDETGKIINQKCQVKDPWKGSFKPVFTEIMKGRYSNAQGEHWKQGYPGISEFHGYSNSRDKSGSLEEWIQDANPNFDSIIYKDVIVSIEAQRHKFAGAQSTLIDIKRKHDNLRTIFPSSIFMGERPALERKEWDY